MQSNKEHTFDEIIALLPDKQNNRCVLNKFLSSLAFIKTHKIFNIVDIQRYLKIGYGDTARIIDALVVLGVVENSDEISTKFAAKEFARVGTEGFDVKT